MDFQERLKERRQHFKKSGDLEESRRKREDEALQLRRQKKDEIMAQKRCTMAHSLGDNVIAENGDEQNRQDPGSVQTKAQKQQNYESQLAQFPHYCEMLFYPSTRDQLAAARAIRQVLSAPEQLPPIDMVLKQEGVIERFVELFRNNAETDLQFEAAWVLTNVSSGTPNQTEAVVRAGAIGAFIDLLDSGSLPLREQVVWALSNIAGDRAQYRNEILARGGMDKLLKVMKEASELVKFAREQGNTAKALEGQHILKNCTWTCSNFCRGAKPVPEFKYIEKCIPVLKEMMERDEDDTIVTDATWALSYISDGEDQRIRAVCEAGVCPRAVQLLSQRNANKRVTAAVRLVGNIISADDPAPTQMMLDNNILFYLKDLLSHNMKSIRRESCWTASNILAGTINQITLFIDSGIFPTIINRLVDDDYLVKRECAWAVGNACMHRVASHIEYFVSIGVIPALCGFLENCANNKYSADQIAVLDAIDNICYVGQRLVRDDEGISPYAEKFELCSGVRFLEVLRNETVEPTITRKTTQILQKYFGYQEEEQPTLEPGMELNAPELPRNMAFCNFEN